mmetsp:Transcript_1053/g.2059  ORF Transcript_1053/g.2059 Transcript_1053/m.2059 type:complete len:258 (-) Transcript_1053:5-778(-)
MISSEQLAEMDLCGSTVHLSMMTSDLAVTPAPKMAGLSVEPCTRVHWPTVEFQPRMAFFTNACSLMITSSSTRQFCRRAPSPTTTPAAIDTFGPIFALGETFADGAITHAPTTASFDDTVPTSNCSELDARANDARTPPPDAVASLPACSATPVKYSKYNPEHAIAWFGDLICPQNPSVLNTNTIFLPASGISTSCSSRTTAVPAPPAASMSISSAAPLNAAARESATVFIWSNTLRENTYTPQLITGEMFDCGFSA